MPLFDGLGRSTEARALEPSEVIAIPYGPIQEVYEARPMLLWSVVAMLSGAALLPAVHRLQPR